MNKKPNWDEPEGFLFHKKVKVFLVIFKNNLFESVHYPLL
jgi:hypothetical protein